MVSGVTTHLVLHHGFGLVTRASNIAVFAVMPRVDTASMAVFGLASVNSDVLLIHPGRISSFGQRFSDVDSRHPPFVVRHLLLDMFHLPLERLNLFFNCGVGGGESGVSFGEVCNVLAVVCDCTPDTSKYVQGVGGHGITCLRRMILLSCTVFEVTVVIFNDVCFE